MLFCTDTACQAGPASCERNLAAPGREDLLVLDSRRGKGQKSACCASYNMSDGMFGIERVKKGLL